jgi:hypothetical protein
MHPSDSHFCIQKSFANVQMRSMSDISSSFESGDCEQAGKMRQLGTPNHGRVILRTSDETIRVFSILLETEENSSSE